MKYDDWQAALEEEAARQARYERLNALLAEGFTYNEAIEIEEAENA